MTEGWIAAPRIWVRGRLGRNDGKGSDQRERDFGTDVPAESPCGVGISVPMFQQKAPAGPNGSELRCRLNEAHGSAGIQDETTSVIPALRRNPG